MFLDWFVLVSFHIVIYVKRSSSDIGLLRFRGIHGLSPRRTQPSFSLHCCSTHSGSPSSGAISSIMEVAPEDFLDSLDC